MDECANQEPFEASQIESEARGMVGYSSGYRNLFIGSHSPEPSAFAATTKNLLGCVGARLLEIFDRQLLLKPGQYRKHKCSVLRSPTVDSRVATQQQRKPWAVASANLG